MIMNGTQDASKMNSHSVMKEQHIMNSADNGIGHTLIVENSCYVVRQDTEVGCTHDCYYVKRKQKFTIN